MIKQLLLLAVLLAAAYWYFSDTEEVAEPQVILLEETIPPTVEESLEARQSEEGESEIPEEALSEAVSADASAHLCYFSFNNPYEVSVARTFVRALSAYPEAPRITVTEFQAEGSDPEDSFQRLVKSGERCDGLVLSGHHDEDGEFWGDRTSGDLEIDFLIELSANPRYGAWFSEVKSLWLQGCHTATTRVFNDDVKSKYRISGSPIGMINKHLDLGEMEDSIEDLYDIFLENTEEDNIILDYGRVFPAATIYTWWDMAPGVESGSHWSFPFHIVQTAFVIDDDPKYFQNPFKQPIPRPAALRYAEILYEGMTRPVWPGKHAGPLRADEDTLIKGWKEHGRWAVHKRKYSFENASAVGHRSLLASHSGILKQLRGLSVLQAQFDEEWVKPNASAVVASILNHEEYIPYNIYLMWAIAQRSASLRAEMARSQELLAHLQYIVDTGGEDNQQMKDYRRFLQYLKS